MGSCMVSEDKSQNLGVVQISPQATGNGSLSILYVNGDRCGNQRYSTRIVFECAQTSVSVPQRLLVVTAVPMSLSLGVFHVGKVCAFIEIGGIASVCPGGHGFPQA